MGSGNSTRHIEIIARAVIRHGSSVLLCRPARKSGFPYLPGGHVEFGERAADAVARELMEECGRSCDVGALLLAEEHHFTDAKGREHHEVNLVFHVALRGEEGDAAGAPPTVQSLEPDLTFEWVELAALPGIDLRPPSMRAYLMAGGLLEGPPAGWLSSMPSPDQTQG